MKKKARVHNSWQRAERQQRQRPRQHILQLGQQKLPLQSTKQSIRIQQRRRAQHPWTGRRPNRLEGGQARRRLNRGPRLGSTSQSVVMLLVMFLPHQHQRQVQLLPLQRSQARTWPRRSFPRRPDCLTTRVTLPWRPMLREAIERDSSAYQDQDQKDRFRMDYQRLRPPLLPLDHGSRADVMAQRA